MQQASGNRIKTLAEASNKTSPLGISNTLTGINNKPGSKFNTDVKVLSIANSGINHIPAGGAGSAVNDSLLIGIELLEQHKNMDAEKFFITYILKHPDNQVAYTELYACANDETTPSLIQYFKSLPAQADKEHKLLLSHLYLKQGDPVSAKAVNDSIIAGNPNSKLGMKAKLNNFYITLHNNNDPDGASAILKDVKTNAALLTSIELSNAQHALTVYINPKTGAMPNMFKEKDTSVSNTISSIKQNELMANYPNPFNPATIISWRLAAAGQVSLKVYDILGREVKTLVNERQEAGIHSVIFDASKLSSGVYFYRIIAGSFISTKKMLVIK